MAQLREFLRQEHAAGKEIYPPGPLIFNALNSTPLDKVKVADPRPGPLPRPRPGPRPVLLGATGRAGAAVAGQYL